MRFEPALVLWAGNCIFVLQVVTGKKKCQVTLAGTAIIVISQLKNRDLHLKLGNGDCQAGYSDLGVGSFQKTSIPEDRAQM